MSVGLVGAISAAGILITAAMFLGGLTESNRGQSER